MEKPVENFWFLLYNLLVFLIYCSYKDKMHKELPVLLDKYGFKMYLAEDIKAKILKKFINKLNKIKSTVVFVSGIGKRKTDFQRDYELLCDWYEREKKYESIQLSVINLLQYIA